MHVDGGAGYAHDVDAGPSRTAVARQTGRCGRAVALGFTRGYMGVEMVGGWATSSLALVGDAAHMFTDAIALGLGLGLFGLWIADQPATERKTYGYHRAEILVALLNGLVLWFVVLGVFWGAWQRAVHPPAVRGGGVLVIASAGLAVNLPAAWLLSGAASTNMSVRGALLHVLSDLLGSVGSSPRASRSSRPAGTPPTRWRVS